MHSTKFHAVRSSPARVRTGRALGTRVAISRNGKRVNKKNVTTTSEHDKIIIGDIADASREHLGLS